MYAHGYGADTHVAVILVSLEPVGGIDSHGYLLATDIGLAGGVGGLQQIVTPGNGIAIAHNTYLYIIGGQGSESIVGL